MEKIIVCLLALFLSVNAVAQTAENQKVLAELRRVSERYRTTPYLGFDIRYRYASEEAPDTYLDSLKGSFKLHGDRYWYSLDQTEAIVTGDIMMLLFREDQVMYLSRPSAAWVGSSPVTVLDSLLTHAEGYKATLKTSGKSSLIHLEFPANSACKSITYEIDARTHLISRMQCVVPATELYDPSVRPVVEGDGVYAVIDIGFANYKENGFDPAQFDTAKYFQKQGAEYVPVAPYQSYKLFLGSPNL